MSKHERIQFSLKKVYKSKLQTQFHCQVCDEDIILLGTNVKVCPICHTSLESIEKDNETEKETIELSQNIGDKIVGFIKKKFGVG